VKVMATVRSSVILQAEDRPQLQEAARALHGHVIESVQITLDDGGTLSLPPVMARAIRLLVTHLAAGEDVSINLLDREYTFTEAVAFLGVTDAYLAQLIADGEIPARLAGTEQRIAFPDLVAYSAKMQERMAEGVRRIQRLSEEEGAYDGR
jgi:excisionase family DNA binding protein